MRTNLRAGVVQMNAGLDKTQNLATIAQLVRKAASDGAELIVLPELCTIYGALANVVLEAEPIPGPASAFFSALAAEMGVYLCAGSLCEQSPTPGRGFNTSLIFGPQGALLASYRKVHLFDAAIPGQVAIRESDYMLGGGAVEVIDTPRAILGAAICYDLRFPELFRRFALQGMEVLLLPSAFTAATGRDHWEVLIRARAIENQCFVLAANQWGRHDDHLLSYGGSLIVDPWGRVLARAPLDSDAVLVADLDGAVLSAVRERLPALLHQRLSSTHTHYGRLRG